MKWLLLIWWLLMDLCRPRPIGARLVLYRNGKRVKRMDIIEGQPNRYQVVAKSVSGKIKPLPGPVTTITEANVSATVDIEFVTFEALADGPALISVKSGELSLDVVANVFTLPAAVLELVPA